MQQPPKTKKYNGVEANPKLFYSHRPQSRRQRHGFCISRHRTMAHAYNCRNNRKHADQISVAFQNHGGLEHRERPVGRDELVLNGLIRPVSPDQAHALLVNLQLRTSPEYDRDLQHRHSQHWYHQQMAVNRIYWLVNRAMTLHYFYTTPTRSGLCNNDFVALLPIEQLAEYQRNIDPIIELTVGQAADYNTVKKLKPGRGGIVNLLSYSLEPYLS